MTDQESLRVQALKDYDHRILLPLIVSQWKQTRYDNVHIAVSFTRVRIDLIPLPLFLYELLNTVPCLS